MVVNVTIYPPTANQAAMYSMYSHLFNLALFILFGLRLSDTPKRCTQTHAHKHAPIRGLAWNKLSIGMEHGIACW